jgi:hypothetical protein
MSKLETPMTRRYWERVRGTLLEEYLVGPSCPPGVGRRLIDAVIIEDGDHRIASRAESVSLSLNEHDIVIVQTKALRLVGSVAAHRPCVSRASLPDHPRHACSAAWYIGGAHDRQRIIAHGAEILSNCGPEHSTWIRSQAWSLRRSRGASCGSIPMPSRRFV